MKAIFAKKRGKKGDTPLPSASVPPVSAVPSAPVDDLPPPQNPNYVQESMVIENLQTQFGGTLDCALYTMQKTRLNIIVEYEKGVNLKEVLDNFLLKIENQVKLIRDNDPNNKVYLIEILYSAEFYLCKNIDEKLSKLEPKYRHETLKLIMTNIELDKMLDLVSSSSPSSRDSLINAIITDIECANRFVPINKDVSKKFHDFCESNNCRICIGKCIFNDRLSQNLTQSENTSAVNQQPKRQNQTKQNLKKYNYG